MSFKRLFCRKRPQGDPGIGPAEKPLRVDLLFDFPLPAQEIFSRADIKTIRSYTFHIACKKDLVKLKKIAHRDRALAADAQDLEFLKKL